MTKENPKGTIGAGMSEETAKKLNKIAAEHPGNEVEETTQTGEGKGNAHTSYRSRYNNRARTVEEALAAYPKMKHIIKLANIPKSNSDIRRYCSLGILNYLYQKNIIEEAKGYVSFDWTKFSVTNRGLRTEYRYTESFFINCLIASFTSFANAAQKIIGEFCSKEFEDKFTEDKELMNAAIEAAEVADERSIDE